MALVCSKIKACAWRAFVFKESGCDLMRSSAPGHLPVFSPPWKHAFGILRRRKRNRRHSDTGTRDMCKHHALTMWRSTRSGRQAFMGRDSFLCFSLKVALGRWWGVGTLNPENTMDRTASCTTFTPVSRDGLKLSSVWKSTKMAVVKFHPCHRRRRALFTQRCPRSAPWLTYYAAHSPLVAATGRGAGTELSSVYTAAPPGPKGQL